MLALKPLFFHRHKRESDAVPVLEKNGRKGKVVECMRWGSTNSAELMPSESQKAKKAERVETMNTPDGFQW